MTCKSVSAFLFALALLAGCAHAPVGSVVRDDISELPQATDTALRPGTIEIDFRSAGYRLNGFLYTARGPGPHPTVVLLHGYPGNEKNLDVAQDLRLAGFNVLFFHYRGAWGSGGIFSFANVIDDVGNALQMLRRRAGEYRVDVSRLMLIGHSMGGFAALQGAANASDVRCVAALASWDLGTAAKVFAADPQSRQTWWDYSDSLAMLAGWNGERFMGEVMANADSFSLVGLAPRLSGKSVLLLAAEQDKVLPVAVYHEPMVTAFRQEPGVTLQADSLPGDHSFSWSREALSRRVVDWASACSRASY